MASSITNTEKMAVGNKFMRLGTGNLGVYTNPGGIAVTANQFALGTLDELFVSPAGGYVFVFDKTNLKIVAYWQNEVAASVLVEVTDSTNLSGVTFRFQAWGH